MSLMFLKCVCFRQFQPNSARRVDHNVHYSTSNRLPSSILFQYSTKSFPAGKVQAIYGNVILGFELEF